MTTIQERLRKSASIPIPETDKDLTLANTQAAMRVHHALHRAAADEIDRLQAALKASDEALLDVQHAATHLMPWTTHQAIRSAQSRVAAARSRAKERCPTCDSPNPKLHPAVQHEGEVEMCRDPWHTPERAKEPQS